MKRRNGFVSNSSSSSFCIFGVSDFSLGDPIELFRSLKKEFPEDFDKFLLNQKNLISAYYSKEVGYRAIVKWIEEGMEGSPYESKDLRGCEHPIGGEGADMSLFCSQCGKPTWIKEDICCEEDMEFITSDLYELFESFDTLSYVSGEGFSAIGMDYSSAPDDMTFGEFRAKANEIISKIVGKETKCEHICEDYYC